MIGGKTRLTGLIGWPVGHSLSPAMHNAAAAALGLDWAYVPLPVRPEGLAAALGGLAALGFAGVNVTVPHKEAALSYLDAVYPVAETIGAVNTIVVVDRKLTGFNTDWSGFLDDVERQTIVGGRECIILGAGGSARAVVYALLHARARVTVLARRAEQATELAAAMREAMPESQLQTAGLDDVVEVARALPRPLIVNTTPLGLAGPQVEQSPWPDGSSLPEDAFVYDLVYNPPLTPLLRQARDAGCRASNGLGMLVNQAVESFELWTQRRPDPAVMRSVAEALL